MQEKKPAEDAPAREWLTYYAWLQRTHSKAEHSETSTSRERASQTLMLALGDAPEHVTIRDLDGAERSVAVHPKSHEALEWFEARTRRIAWLVQQRDQLQSRPDAESLMLAERCGLEVSHQYRLLVVAATTPGPGLSWDVESSPDKSALPEWSADLSPTETLAVRNAFIEVNALRLQVITEILSPSKRESAPPLGWATFFALRAEEAGVSSTVLLRDRSLASQIAAATLAAEAKLSAAEESPGTDKGQS